jgi:hypothetical protein
MNFLIDLALWSSRHVTLTALLSALLLRASWQLHRATRLVDTLTGPQQ